MVRGPEMRKRTLRTRLMPAHVRAIAAVLALALIVSIGYVLVSTPRTEAIAPVMPKEVVQVPADVLVHVAGDVSRPGVYALPIGARVIDAVTAAGGALAGADTTTVNLARVVEDGEQIVVGRVAAQGSGRLDLNTATAEELDGLPGIGPVIAARIVQWRSDHGRFRTIDQLKDVSGVGAATFASLRKLIAVR